MSIAIPFGSPLYVMLKPVGSRCNLNCRYCYYLEKGRLYPNQEPLSEELLETFIQQYLEAQTMPEVLFTWHGGEPLLQPLSFYRKALALQQKYAHGRQIDNCLQTNGTLLTDEWCEFLRENRFLVGISIDGPQPFHDAYRCRSFEKVMRGVRLLQKHHVEWNAMATVNHLNADHPAEFYRFFKVIGCQYLQFTPVIERVSQRDGSFVTPLADVTKEPSLCDTSVTPEQWGSFLCGVYDEWVKEDIGRIFVQLFDATLANWCGVAPGVCSLAKYCGHAGVMEHNGNVYSCDHFVYPEYLLGNIKTKGLVEMMYSERQTKFGHDKYDTLPRQCKECIWLFACNGECPKNRLLNTKDGESGLNYLCEGYQMYFEHVAPVMEHMRRNITNVG